MSSAMSEQKGVRQRSTVIHTNNDDLLSEIVRSGKRLIAVWANVWPLLSVGAHMSSRPNKSALEVG